MTSICPQCLQKFEQKRSAQEFCKPECRKAYLQELYTERSYKRIKLREAPPPSLGLPQGLGITTLSDGCDADDVLQSLTTRLFRRKT